MIGPQTFETTRKPFWGGPWYPYWTLVMMTVLGGFFGLDHLWLRSPSTAFAKLVVNILGLGIWWVYDMIQVLGEPTQVQEMGLSAPMVGPLGIGAGMFRDNQPGVALSRAPFRWFLYSFLVLLPFGFDFFIAGDTNGGVVRLISTILFPLGFVWGCVNMYRATFMPKSVFTEGTYRMWPFTWFMDKYGPSVLGPQDIPDRPDGCEPGGSVGFFRGIYNQFILFIDMTLPPIIKTGLNVFFPGLVPAMEAVSAATVAGATTAKAAANVATSVLEAAKNPAVIATATASDLVQKVPGAVAEATKVAGSVGTQLQKFTSPEGLKAAAAASAVGAATKMKGGAMILSEVNSTLENTIILAVIGAILIGGTVLAARRLNIGQVSQKDPNDRRARNDTPPQPSSV